MLASTVFRSGATILVRLREKYRRTGVS